MSSHGSHRSVIFVLFFLYFGSTGIPSDIKLCLTGRSTTLNDFSSRTTITSAENPDFEIWLELNSPYEFSTAYSANNRADSLHRKLLSYRQNRNDAIKDLFRRSSCYFNTLTEIQAWQTPVYILLKLNPGPTNNDNQSTISTHCSRGRCAALSTRSAAAVLSFAPNVNRLPFHNTSHGIPVHTTSMCRRDYNRSYMIANLNNIPCLNRVSQVPNSRFCKNFTSCLLNARSVCNKTLVIKDFVVDHAVDLLGITETWLHLKGGDVTIGELCLSVYRFVHTPDRRGLVGV